MLYADDPGLGCFDTTVISDSCSNTSKHPPDDLSALRYKVSYPKKTIHNYETAPLPVIFLFHPGGYKECPPFDDDFMTLLCREFARKGFVCCTVGYRTGKLEDESANHLINQTAQQQFAIYRGQQDGRGAIRSFFKRQAEDNHGGRFIVNADQCFVGGASAGAALAMGLAYYRTASMINMVFPSASNSDLTIQEALGAVTEDYYYGEPTGSYFPVIRGVLNCWGGILIPESYDDGNDNGASESVFFSTANALANPPVIGFAGALDDTVDYLDDDQQYKIFSTTVPWKKENFCLKDGISGTYKIKKQVGDPLPYIPRNAAPSIYTIFCRQLI
ncbi:MAG TPA: hypothetical protein PLA68_02120 [Panacibacter sp.]|nr:hypothetical protein [Panacibacter sp.]